MKGSDERQDYYDALRASSRGWHENTHDLKPYAAYILGVVLKTYKEFASRLDGIVNERVSKADRIRNVIAAAYDENGKADACTLAFYTPSSHKPPCLTIAINATARRKTLKSILRSGAFTVGYPSIEQVAEADWIGMASGYEHDAYDHAYPRTRPSRSGRHTLPQASCLRT